MSRRKPPKPGATSTRNCHTSPSVIARAKRIRAALEYREAGHTFAEIGRHMGIPLRTAADLVDEGIRRLPRESPRLVADLHRRRLDAMHAAVYPRAAAGDLKAQEAVLAIMDRQARLEGIDAARPGGTVVNVNVTVNNITVIVTGGLPGEPIEPEIDAEALPVLDQLPAPGG